ncbi:hypothetical protein QRX50_45340 [Amycolatopsis carbonis]|uniref:Uncharacterized protein n=1 Tax=Amycolatopsis carbonis TaxID=715471 RepID=A0A9Y2IDR0_9PSEU|nr:hypothetical protein [Amycolatopsis sp. 2-15]WIX78500.1 hypothetical protein QRX50_45340 [Amycolatopsis sp. 2-15]
MRRAATSSSWRRAASVVLSQGALPLEPIAKRSLRSGGELDVVEPRTVDSPE